MKRTITIVLAAAAVVLAGVLAFQFAASPSGSGGTAATAPGVALAQGIPMPPNSAYRDGIFVTGEGRITVEPDIAQITVGVEVSDPSASAAAQNAATQMEAVVGQLRAQGIEDKDIQTVRYSLAPEYDYSSRTPVLKGYRATNLVMVKLRDIARVGQILDTVTASGATRVQGISFSVSDPAAATTAGRDEAMKNARTKADQLAAAAGVTLGRPIAIEEISSPQPAAMEMVRQAAPAADMAATTPINPGTQEISVMVRVVYAIQ